MYEQVSHSLLNAMLDDLADKTPYFQEPGISMVHIMPILMCPTGKSDGGYAVSDFRQIHDRIGDLYEAV
jgi:amylosucrase